MIAIVIYLIIFLGAVIGSLIMCLFFPSYFIEQYKVLIFCTLVGGIGGLVYCLRGVYLNYCVRKSWDNSWRVWYIIRPVVSLLCGGVSFIFLKAGLLILESQNKSSATFLAFYAFAFIAGYNVDRFLNKVEDFAQKAWGIEKSRAGKKAENEEV